MTVNEFADKYKITRQTLYKWIKQGMPTEIQIGRIIRIDEGKTLEWIKERADKGGE